MSLAEMVQHNHGGDTGDDTPDHTHNYATVVGVRQGPPGGAESLVVGSTGTTAGANNRHHHPIPNAGNTTPFNVVSPTVFLNAEVKL